MTAPALVLEGIVKRFGETLALDGADLSVRPGSVHALLGENGAGKTTLMRIAFGMIRADDGTIAIAGQRRAPGSPAAAIAAGIGMVHQHFTHVPAMTVAENVALGQHGRYTRAGAAARVRAVADRAGLPLDPEARVADLPVSAQQRLEILKALAREAHVLILDEPTALLAPSEASELLRWARGFADEGHALILITHKLGEALAVADDVTVLRRGRTVLSASAASVDAPTLARALLGETTTSFDAAAVGGTLPSPSVAPIVVAERARITDDRGVERVRDASFEVRPGEILGVAGVEGAGQHELLQAVAGRMRLSDGRLALPAAASIAFIPEDRHRDGVVLDFSVAENLALRGAGRRRGVVRWRHWARRAESLAREYDIRAAGPRTPVAWLSGGNQQKLVLARELSGDPSLVVAENPTRGLDIRATTFVHAQLRHAAARGAAVVVYSTDLDEVLALATRLLVVHAGRVTAMAPDRELAGLAMLGTA